MDSQKATRIGLASGDWGGVFEVSRKPLPLLGTQVSCIVCVAAATWEDCASHADPSSSPPV